MPFSTEDRLAIMQLDARANHAWDCGTVDEWVGNYVDDGVFEMQNHPSAPAIFRGREELTRLYEGAHAGWGPGPHWQHWHVNHVIEGDGNTASHRCYHIGLAVNDGVPGIRSMGVWYSLLENRDGGWKYTHAKIVFDIHL